jgi:excinuclease ABC subunit C
MYALLKVLRALFFIRSCDLPLTEKTIVDGKYSTCLDYQMKKCEGPCELHVSREGYNKGIQRAVQILKGKTRSVEKELEEEMQLLAEDLRFEEAAKIKQRYELLRQYAAKQKVVSTDPIDRDILSFAQQGDDACSVIFKVRDGKLIGKQHYYIAHAEGKSEADIVRATCQRFYLESEDVPQEIFLPAEIDEIETLEQWLTQKRNSSVHISVPKIGDKHKLVRMVTANAEFLLRELEIQRTKREQTIPRIMYSLQRDLRLKSVPRRLECFDNSHFQGSETVSSMVVFIDGKPRKSEYRKYKNKTVDGIDDFESMREVIRRRYTRMLNENSERPDVIIVDGGKGQLSSAVEVLKDIGLFGKIPIIGLAKRLEEVFFPNESESLILPKTSSSLRLLQQLRDEAHRFAITFHRSLRDKRTLSTELIEINGVGEKTAQKLLVKFGSVQGIRNASNEDLQAVVGAKLCSNIRTHFANETS